jgi:dihydrofolate reductase
MRKLKVTTFLTLDGVMQGPGGPEEDAEGGFAHGGWSVNYWDDSTLIKGDVTEEVAELKEQDGPEIQVHGSGDLIQTLLKHGLVDEFHLMIFPVVLGAGKRLFGEGTIAGGLKLADSKVAKTGVIMARYEPAGAVPYGSFAATATA